MRIFEVGGCIRNELMNLPVKDIDFAIEAPSFDEMIASLEQDGFEIFESRPEFLTVRAKFPKTDERRKKMTADFVMCREDGFSSDARRPDQVFASDIFSDLARRDFTVNAIARDINTGEILDPHNGRKDIESRTLRFVGEPMDRVREDSLRVLRALRFMITNDLEPTLTTWKAIQDDESSELMENLPIERRFDELVKMFAFDTIKTIEVLEHDIPRKLRDTILDGFRLQPTTKKKLKTTLE